MALFTGSKKKEKEDVDAEANRLARSIGRQRIQRRKWAMETACMANEEMSVNDRIELARKIEAYVWEE